MAVGFLVKLSTVLLGVYATCYTATRLSMSAWSDAESWLLIGLGDA